ncbi:class I adenylate-forming enzyme family protein [Natronomonas salsuginis]|uniref:Long-chain fatty acid--CoA ligase n=1 Tax=Natronomonas salsuginis TaxID=2217661 RepID=A0A4U5JJA0_9EURY|nr:AMP-binding protein [Natronomonas salsuginis]TKR26169.1 long-chain fatty acid--CoA ligase [Natronomonas salsuginis]
MISHRTYLERNATWRGDETALEVIESNESYSYGEFDAEVNRVANALADRGIRKSDRVAMVLFNTTEFPITLYACYKIGAVPVPINFMLARDNFAYIFDDVVPKAVVYDETVAEDVEASLERADVPARRIGVGSCPAADEGFESLAAEGDAAAPPEVPVRADDPAYILYTSGTTGAPKGVTFTTETASNRAQEGSRCLGLSKNSVALQVSPWFHAGGVDLTVHPTIEAGGTIIVTENWEPEPVADLVEAKGITHIVGVPTVAQRMAELDDIDDRDLSSLECLLCMGSPLSKRLAETLLEVITSNVFNGYGTTETLLDSVLRPEDLPEKAGAAGQPTHDTEMRLIEYRQGGTADPDATVPHGEEGEIIVSGASVMDYYFGSETKTKDSIRDGWYYTSDLGVVDEDGFLTVTGRADDMILSGGELVSPIEVEEILEEHQSVEGAVVVGEDDEEWGQLVTAYVVGDTSADELDTYCADHDSLADYKRPRQYHFVDSLERTATGKKQRYQYRD